MNKITGKLGLVLLVGTIVLGMAGFSQGALIAEWNYTSLSSPPPAYLSANTDNAVGTPTQTLVNTAFAGASNDFQIKNLSQINRGISWAVSTEGYKDISVSFDVKKVDNEAPSSWKASYFNGTTWVNWENVTNITAEYQTFTFNLSMFDMLEGLSNFEFIFLNTVTAEGGNSTAKNNKKVAFDNVKFTGTVVPIPAAAWLLGTGLIGLVVIRRKRG